MRQVSQAPISATIELKGHLIDSLTLAKAMDIIQTLGGEYQLNDLRIGSHKIADSYVNLSIFTVTEEKLHEILEHLKPLGANQASAEPISFIPSYAPASTPQVLMCPPDYFNVEYVINPWMASGQPCDVELAKRQWDALYLTISKKAGADVLLMTPEPGVPDLVFTANAAFVHQKKAIIAHYKYPERQPEEPYCEAWFKANGFETFRVPNNIYFEGAGDALIWQDRVFAGYKTRTDIAAHSLITANTGLPVLSLELINPKFYHIDVCCCPLYDGHFIYYPDAFDDYGKTVIEANVPASKRIPVTAEEANLFACNSVNINDTVIFNQGSDRLADELKARGFQVLQVDLSEFIKSGGSSKCLTLRVG